MKKIRKLLGVICLICALVVMQLPPSEAIAANEASDFSIYEDTVLTKYVGKSATVVIPNGIQTIATDAFKDNAYVSSVVIPKTCKTIEPYAFWGCSIKSVTFGSGLEEIGDYAFANCKQLASIDVPENIKRIGLNAFVDDISLTDATITYKTMQIHDTAFDGCYKLVIHAPEGSYPYKYAQDFYKRQLEFNEYEDVSNWNPDNGSGNTSGENGIGENGSGSGSGNGSGDNQTDSNGSGEIHFIYNPDGTVSSKTDYSSIINDNNSGYGSVHVVGNQAVFFMDSSSPNVYMGSNPPKYEGDGTSADGTGSGDGTGDGVLNGNTLPKYTIVDGLIVADQAYYCNTTINYVVLPETVKEIGQFSYARSSVSSILLPESLERISYGAFYHCGKLTSITIPESVLFIEPKAFEHTAWVDNFYNGILSDEQTDINAKDFLISGTSLIAYKGTAEKVIIPDGVKCIAAGVFKDHTEIKTVEIPKTLVSIGEEAFMGCTSLADINLEGSSVKYILDRAFYNTAIDKIILPSALLELGINAFDNDAVLFYLGSAPTIKHENTAERLSNADYRNLAYKANLENNDSNMNSGTSGIIPDLAPGVMIVAKDGTDITGIQAYLEASSEGYLLEIGSKESDAVMNAAKERASSALVGKNYNELIVYDMKLYDKSGIEITKFGKTGLTVAIPISDMSKLAILTVDRNGQLEEVPAETISVEGRKYLRFTTYHLSPFAICSTGDIIHNNELIVADEVISALAARPVAEESLTDVSAGTAFMNWVVAKKWRLLIAGAFIIAGVVLLAYKENSNKEKAYK